MEYVPPFEAAVKDVRVCDKSAHSRTKGAIDANSALPTCDIVFVLFAVGV